jgi:hypothetical protein
MTCVVLAPAGYIRGRELDNVLGSLAHLGEDHGRDLLRLFEVSIHRACSIVQKLENLL